jgi:hypothetical protein
MLELKKCIEETAEGKRVFPYCGKTGYNIVRRAFKYPHLFRLSRITKFFVDGYTIAQVRHADFLDFSHDKETDATHTRVNSSCP